MSYPYGGPPGGFPAPGGYPAQGGYPTGGYMGAAPSFPPAPGGYGIMPTPETAMSATYDSAGYGAGGLPYAPQPGLGFNMGAPNGMGGQPMQMPGAPGYPSQPGYPSGPPAPSNYGGMPPSTGAYPGSVPPSMGGYPGMPSGPPGGMPSGPLGGMPSGPPGGMPSGPLGGMPTGPPGGMPTGPPGGMPSCPPGGMPSGPNMQSPYQPQSTGPPGGYMASTPSYQQNTQSAYPQLSSPAQPSYNNYQQQPVSVPSTVSGGQFPPSSLNSQFAYQEKSQGTLKPYAGFNAESDAKQLRKAMKGFGTDEKAIIDILAYRSNAQRQDVKKLYKTCFGKDLMNDLRSELGGRFEDLILALMLKPDDYDAQELRRSMAGAGTDEDCLIEILCSRSNKDIQNIATAYRARYGKNLEKDIISDTSGHFKRLMVSLANGGRMEGQSVDINKARADAQSLYQAGEKRWGTDESQFNAILASQSFPQLRAVFAEYKKLTGKDIERSIVSEMSGDLAKGMLSVVRVVQNKHNYFCDKLYHSMKGLGTDDRTLIRIIVTRAEIDMVQIKQMFQQKFGQSLEKFIREDTSGDYRRALLALIGGGGI